MAMGISGFDSRALPPVSAIDPQNPADIYARFNGFAITKHVYSKFLDFVSKGRLPARKSIWDYLWRSNFHEAPDALLQDLRFGLDINSDSLWLRSCRVSNSTTLIFIGQGFCITEIVSQRGLRSLLKRGFYRLRELGLMDSNENDRIKKICKFTCRVKIQGGLMRGPLRPQVRHF